MGAVTAGSRAAGAVRVLVIAAVLGTTYLGNTFQATNAAPTIVFEVLAAGALSAVLVPTFVTYLARGAQADTQRLAAGLLGLALVPLGLLSVAMFVAAPQVAAVLTSAVSDPTVAAQQNELATFLLRVFAPQIPLYAFGAIAIAVLNAKRSFSLPAAAPIGNTVVLIGFLLVFQAMAGPNPGLVLTTAERWVLGLGGTLGVVAFVGIPTVALWRQGFWLWPSFRGGADGDRRWVWRDHRTMGLLRMSAWAVLQQGAPSVLLGLAIVLGGAVAGGVVAYQVAWMVFLAPYAVVAQPIHTAIAPDLVEEAARDDAGASLASSVRWALDVMAVLVIPVAAVCVTLAVPAMQVVAFGRATEGDGVALMGAALAALGLGLFGYGASMMLARVWYTVGDSRTPALVTVICVAVGVVAMTVLAAPASGSARLVGLGLGTSLAFDLSAVVLGVLFSRRTGHSVWPRALPVSVLAAVPLALAAGWAVHVADPSGRLGTAGLLAVVIAGAGALYTAIIWLAHPVAPRVTIERTT